MSEDLFQEIKRAAEQAEFDRLGREICDAIDESYARAYGVDIPTMKEMMKKMLDEHQERKHKKKVSWFKRFKNLVS